MEPSVNSRVGHSVLHLPSGFIDGVLLKKMVARELRVCLLSAEEGEIDHIDEINTVEADSNNVQARDALLSLLEITQSFDGSLAAAPRAHVEVVVV